MQNQISDLEHEERNAAMWDKRADSLDGDGRFSRYLRKAQSELISLMNLKEGMSLLDVGCGTGWALGHVAGALHGRGRFVGVDLSPQMIERAKAHFGDRDSFRFVQASAEAVPLDGESFDVVICSNSFHHYLRPLKALQEMRRLLKPGGRIYLLDPTADRWWLRQADKLIRILEPEHVKMYSTKEFRELFGRAGLTYLGTRAVHWRGKVHRGERPAE